MPRSLTTFAAIALLVGAGHASAQIKATPNPNSGPEKKLPADRMMAGGKKTPPPTLVARKKAPADMPKSDASKGSPTMPGGIGTGAKSKERTGY